MSTQARLQVLGGSMIGSQLEFWTITAATFDISGVDAASEARLNAIVQTIAAHGQPVIMDLISATSMRFAIEHVGAWGADGTALSAALTAMIASEFPADATAGATLSAVKATGL